MFRVGFCAVVSGVFKFLRDVLRILLDRSSSAAARWSMAWNTKSKVAWSQWVVWSSFWHVFEWDILGSGIVLWVDVEVKGGVENEKVIAVIIIIGKSLSLAVAVALLPSDCFGCISSSGMGLLLLVGIRGVGNVAGIVIIIGKSLSSLLVAALLAALLAVGFANGYDVGGVEVAVV